jgi:hypothetical protein
MIIKKMSKILQSNLKEEFNEDKLYNSIGKRKAGIHTQELKRIPVPFSPAALASVVVFLMIVNLTGVRQNLSVVLICISFMTKDVEYLCIYLSSI